MGCPYRGLCCVVLFSSVMLVENAEVLLCYYVDLVHSKDFMCKWISLNKLYQHTGSPPGERVAEFRGRVKRGISLNFLGATK